MNRKTMSCSYKILGNVSEFRRFLRSLVFCGISDVYSYPSENGFLYRELICLFSRTVFYSSGPKSGPISREEEYVNTIEILGDSDFDNVLVWSNGEWIINDDSEVLKQKVYNTVDCLLKLNIVLECLDMLYEKYKNFQDYFNIYMKSVGISCRNEENLNFFLNLPIPLFKRYLYMMEAFEKYNIDYFVDFIRNTSLGKIIDYVINNENIEYLEKKRIYNDISDILESKVFDEIERYHRIREEDSSIDEILLFSSLIIDKTFSGYFRDVMKLKRS